MTREEIRESLEGIFRDLFMSDDIKLQDSTTANDVDGWDSLTHIHLILAVEQTMNVKFSLPEVQKLKNVGDLISSIQTHKQPGA